jgi:tetratricopeptide (TPR) repeat protein
MKKILFLYLLFFSLYLQGESSAKQLEAAKESYQSGIQAKNWQERLASLNQALTDYSQIEENFGPSFELNHTLGDLFFELTEFPFAILYYEKALYEQPNDQTLKSNLHLARKKLGLETSSERPPSYLSIMLLDSFLSQTRRLQIFFFTTLLTLLLMSLYIWKPHSLLKISCAAASLFAFLILISYLLAFYFSPIEGIIISATGLYREPKQQAAQLTRQPILAGLKVRVIDTAENGFWLKIIDEEGQLGYVPSTALRII